MIVRLAKASGPWTDSAATKLRTVLQESRPAAQAVLMHRLPSTKLPRAGPGSSLLVVLSMLGSGRFLVFSPRPDFNLGFVEQL